MQMSETKTASQAAFKGVTSLFHHLPTGTVFLYQFLSPIVTNNGQCKPVNKFLSAAMILCCAMSCVVSTISDSYTDAEGNKMYGIATRRGMWPRSATADLSEYRLKVGDFVHSLFSLMVFATISLLDSNAVGCFYPSFKSLQNILVMALPPVIGAASGVIFVLFPNKRHGIGLKRKEELCAAENGEDEGREAHGPATGKTEEQQQTTIISYFVTNFPDHFTPTDLWIIFSSVGRLVDVTIPKARTRKGTRFAYVRFGIRSLQEFQECESRISGVRWGDYKLVAYPARPRRFAYNCYQSPFSNPGRAMEDQPFRTHCRYHGIGEPGPPNPGPGSI